MSKPTKKKAPAKAPAAKSDISIGLIDVSELPVSQRGSKYDAVIEQAALPEIQSGKRAITLVIPTATEKSGAFSIRKVFTYRNVPCPKDHRWNFRKDPTDFHKFYISVVPIKGKAK